MSPATWQFLGTIAAASFGLVGIWLSVRKESQRARTDAATDLLNQLQEERKTLTDRVAQLERKLEAAETELRASRHREMDRDDFMQALRNQLRAAGQEPPPWPKALRNG